MLVGFMGAGKSSLGPRVAKRLGLEFLDMDRKVEERLGMSVGACFESRGEAAFRREELEVARELLGRDRLVVAAGGGAFAQPRTRALLQRKAITVWLRAPLHVLLGRLPPDGSRPLASNRGIMRRLLAAREPAYREADLTVDTADVEPAAAAERVVQAVLGESRGVRGR